MNVRMRPLVFTDALVYKCLLVMVFPTPSDKPGFSHEDYTALTEWHAHCFMGRCMCIFHDDEEISWVRATYVTEDQLNHPDFRLSSQYISFFEDPPMDSASGQKSYPPFFTVTRETVKPRLLTSDVFKIDSVWAQDPKLKSNPVPVPKSVHDKVIGDKDTRVHFPGSEWQLQHYRACSYCGTSKKDEVHVCARMI
ncbi:hypothetical protein CPB84DRAFT_181398 [Gymnopilus junonius]|uniref:Uncharacterized protein n=1 Tax=Gymnopilus junonius TaxID=109634 RepID=A0A9P5NHJ0_GYMJU|nr:hypothetical protein CPB84DRAFT_181398 [Gymnopilus junonius]